MFARHDTIAFIAYPKQDGTYSDLTYQVFRARDRSARVVDTGNITLTDTGNGQLAGAYEPAKLSPGTYDFALSTPFSVDNKGLSAGTFVAGGEFMIVSPPRVASRVTDPGTGSGTATDRDTGMQLTVDRIRLDPVAGGGDAESRAGTTFLLLHVSFRNAGTGAGNFDVSNVAATDQGGRSYHPTPDLSTAYSPQLDTGTVSQGHRQAGWIGYQLPYSVRTLELTWSDLGNVDPPARLAAYALHN